MPGPSRPSSPGGIGRFDVSCRRPRSRPSRPSRRQPGRHSPGLRGRHNVQTDRPIPCPGAVGAGHRAHRRRYDQAACSGRCGGAQDYLVKNKVDGPPSLTDCSMPSMQAGRGALDKSEAFYHSLVESLPQNIFRKDLDGRFTFANAQILHRDRRDDWNSSSARPMPTFSRPTLPSNIARRFAGDRDGQEL